MKNSVCDYIEFNKEVREAKERKLPIVALESTIISHGMPYPTNVKMANKVEQIIRDNGAVPATIAIINGKIKVGLEPEDLETLANTKDVVKVSRRDLAAVITQKKLGATTVATTMICANMVGIKFFVTGGIGGVHRGFEETMDVSADLDELSQTDVCVICAGAKSILDLPRTLEYLETKGVPVIGYQTDELPAFFTRKSGCKLNLRLDNVRDIARLIYNKEQLGLKGGVLVTNPIPERDSMDKEYIDSVIEAAIKESKEKSIHGKNVTPFLLKTIVEKTGGKSLQANLNLVYNNARVGAKIAVAFSKLG
jgi:pseudouridine-5'-phosphate glycosidase